MRFLLRSEPGPFERRLCRPLRVLGAKHVQGFTSQVSDIEGSTRQAIGCTLEGLTLDDKGEEGLARQLAQPVEARTAARHLDRRQAQGFGQEREDGIRGRSGIHFQGGLLVESIGDGLVETSLEPGLESRPTAPARSLAGDPGLRPSQNVVDIDEQGA